MSTQHIQHIANGFKNDTLVVCIITSSDATVVKSSVDMSTFHDEGEVTTSYCVYNKLQLNISPEGETNKRESGKQTVMSTYS